MNFKSKSTLILAMLVVLIVSQPLSLTGAFVGSEDVNSAMTGSLMGGTKLTIIGTGFTTQSANIAIMVGSYPCALEDGTMPTSISCITSDSTSGGQNMADKTSLRIQVIQNQEPYTLVGYTFSYVSSKTPQLYDIIPSSSVPDRRIFFSGIHKITHSSENPRDEGQLTQGIDIGDDKCTTIDIAQDISANSVDLIQCQSSALQEGGKYTVKESVLPGYAQKSDNLEKSSLTAGEYYEYTVIPAVESVTPNSGFPQSQDITIIGSGFSNDKLKMTVDVDGTDCTITKSTNEQILCTLAARQVGDTQEIATNSSTAQVDGFIAGSGFKYYRYNIDSLSSKTYSSLKTAVESSSVSITLEEEGVLGELETQDDDTVYGKVLKGYFYAPVSGSYIFRGASDDNFGLYISDDYGTASVNPSPEIYSTSHTSNKDNYYISEQSTALGSPRTLQGGKYYYMELYHCNTGGNGYVKISVEVPNSDTTLKWQRHEVNSFGISFTNDPQIRRFTLESDSPIVGGTFKLSISRTRTGELRPYYEKEVVLPYNATASQFKSSLDDFDSYARSISVDLEVFDENGVATTSDAGAKYVWTVTIPITRTEAQTLEMLRSDLTLIEVATGATKSFTEVQVQPHGPMIAGTFTLEIGGTPIALTSSNGNIVTDIPHDITASALQTAFRQIEQFKDVQVYRSGSKHFGFSWLITYYKLNLDVPDMVLSGSMLTGGLTGTTPQISFTETRKYSSNLIFSPVDQRFMFTASSEPSVHVFVNDIPSACIGACGYTFQSNTPEITAQSIVNTNQLSITISDPAGANYATNSLKIKIDEQDCTNVAGTFTSLTCDLSQNTDNSPIIRAGDHHVKVHVQEQGIVSHEASVQPINVPLTLTSLTPATGAANGGYQVVIAGTGFPLAVTDAAITLCGSTVKAVSISNIATTITVPECAIGTQSLSYTYKGITQTINFDYTAASNAVTITGISPASASPALKAVMTITGTGFPAANAMTVHLANAAGKVYDMKIIDSTATQIRCGIPGGLPGNFEVIVQVTGVGNAVASPATANDFVYQLVVQSLTPTTGSYNGGTQITITGRNFAPDLKQNLISISDQMNWYCRATSITATTIICRTPPRHPDWTSQTQPIIVASRLVVDSTCDGSCTFTYKDLANSIELDSLSTDSTFSGTGTITLTGRKFDLTGTLADLRVVFKNYITKEETVVVPTSTSATQITIDTPELPGGLYQAKVRLDPEGESNSLSITLKTQFSPASYTGSVEGGSIVLTGHGLPDGWPAGLTSITITSNNKLQDVEVISSTPDRLELKVPAGTNSQSYSVTLRNPDQVSYTATFTQLTTATPAVTVSTSSPLTAGSNTISLAITAVTSAVPTTLYIYSATSPDTLTEVPFTRNANDIEATLSLASGKYGFKVWYATHGWAAVTGDIDVSKTGTYTVTPTDSSFAGGMFTVTGSDIGAGAVIKVGGMTGKVVSQTAGSTVFEVPKLVTADVIGWYPTLSETQYIMPSAVISDGGLGQKYAVDDRHHTEYSSSNADCYIGIDAGADLLVNPVRIRYFPYSQWAVVANYLLGAVIQGSTDGTTYVTLHTVGSQVHSGWNSFMLDVTDTYRFFRIKHDSTSECKIAQFQVYGVLYNDITATATTTVDVTFDDGFNTQVFTGAILYKQTATPKITGLSQTTGSIVGGYSLTLTGQNLGALDILIDNVACTVTASTATSVDCDVGQRASNYAQDSTFMVSLNGNKAVIQQQFTYVLRWSDPDTWGTDMAPIQGDLVYVPKGMSLYVDQSTPRLQGIIVEEGKIIFADEGNSIQVHTGFITVNRGQFRAGTKESPYQSNLKFVMYGNYVGAQMPTFGNKGIGCLQCKFSMYGKVRSHTWTSIQNTIDIGDTTLEVMDAVDWQVGETIVVASTDFDHNQAEEKTITAITGTTITVDSAFVYKHFAGQETYGTATLTMRAEVGLLSRNIKMMGDPTSEAEQYGSHLMMAGSAEKGLVSDIGYTEFTHCGQPKIVGRYCMHFHMNGDVSASSVTGNAVHHSFARVLTLHAIQYLKVKDNVGYKVKGHNFFIEDGIETQNILDHNLAISSLQSFSMMQTDTSVASFWVTNPLNDLINNHAAGGDFYAFWYEIKEHPDGPSQRTDVCPEGMPLGASHDNVAHSYRRFGLRIFKLSPRTHPCKDHQNSALADPWSENPSIQSRFYNYQTYKIGQSGLLAEETGNMIFENFVMAEAKHAGMEFYRTNLTKEAVVARNIVIIGVTLGNAPADLSVFDGVRGAIGPRTSNWKMQNVKFYNFPATTTILQTCSKCDDSLLYTNTAIEYEAEQIQMTNISGKILVQNGLRRSIVYDLDGTFTTNFDGTTRPSATIVPKYPHLEQETACVSATTVTDWDNALVCDETVKVRGIKITNAQPHNSLVNMGIKIQKIADLSEVVAVDSTSYSQFKSLFGTMEPKDKKFSWQMPYIVGSTYNVWWGAGIDFTHIAIQASQRYTDTEDAVFFKFNHTEQRELYEIGDIVQRQYAGDWRTISAVALDATTCNLGDYFQEPDEKYMALCVSGKGKAAPYQYLGVNGIKCRYLCPSPTGEFVKQNFVRVWSNATQWPNGVLPSANDNVSINGNWTIKMDMQPAEMQYFEIDGDVIIPDDLADVTIKAKSIWIRAGSIKAGNSSAPHPNKITFEITGNRDDDGYVFTPDIAGTKAFLVTGKLHLYGQTPSTVWTRMKASASSGDTSITVGSTSGWAVDDFLAIAPSYSSGSQYEKVQITAISGNTVTFTPALQYNHYGASGVTIDNQYGTLDTRTAVGVLNRNIRIISGADNGWGYKLIAHSFLDGQIERYGHLILSGVELDAGGQYDTENAVISLDKVIGEDVSKIEKSSFHNCKSYCLNIKDSKNLVINNNLFYEGRINHVRAIGITSYSFTNNLMIAAIARPTAPGAHDLIACYASWQGVDETVSVKDNVCQGSALHGFALGYTPCEATALSYQGNTASSSPACFIFGKVSGSTCMKASGVRAFACGIAQITSSPGTKKLMFEDFIIADSGRAVTLRMGGEGDDQTAYFKDSYITAISRPSCTDCYGSGAIDCTNNQGVRMLAVTVNGQSMPDKFGAGFDVICKQQSFDSKAFLTNVTFDSYRQTYTTLPQCSNNVVFKPHPTASDMTGSHHLRDSPCTNCQLTALAYFTQPSQSNFGWEGGCGDFLCTGKNNYLIHDYTGGFLPSPGVLIANNSEIGDNSAGCTHVPEINGHYCDRQDFGVMQYESIAPDFNLRIMWPVFLQYEGGAWRSKTNGWREWEWQGNQPLNKRLGRFVSIVELSQVYNMTFNSEPPIDMRLQFQRRSEQGDNSQYVVIKLQYPRPNSIRVMTRTGIVKPIKLRDENIEQLDTAVCGSNKFFYDNYTIHFVMTGHKDCQVRVSLTNSIQLTARFSMDINDFFNIDGETKFIDRMCALLNVTDTSRLKIVGVFTGSVVIRAYLEEAITQIQNAPNHDNPASALQMLQYQQILAALYDNGTMATTFPSSEGFGQVIQFNTEVYDHPVVVDIVEPTDPAANPDEPEPNPQVPANLGLIIGVTVGGVAVLAGILAGVLYMIRKRAKIEQVKVHNESLDQNKVPSSDQEDNYSVINFGQKK